MSYSCFLSDLTVKYPSRVGGVPQPVPGQSVPGPDDGGGAPASSRDGTLTVLFTDIEESTALAAQLGDVVYHDLLVGHYAELRRAIAAHGGKEVKDRGDGLMVVFTSARAAVDCARDMQRAAAPGVLPLKIGINSGELIEGEIGDFYGHAANLAARLSEVAAGGEILVSSLTWGLTRTAGDLEFSPPRAMSLKGIPDPEDVRAVPWAASGDATDAAVGAPGHLGLPLPSLVSDEGALPFVGREDGWAVLDKAWAAVRGGGRGLVLLAGEPGVGKTRLASEFARHVHAEGGVVLAGRCDDELGLAYQPFVEALRHCAANVRGGVLRRTLGPLGGELRRLRPELAAEVPGLPPPLAGDPDTERYRLFDAVAGWLRATSETAPVVIVVDDLQWAAKPTVLLLRHLLRTDGAMRVLFVGTYRDTDVGRAHPLAEALADILRIPGVVRARVAGLDAAEVTDLMTAAGHVLDKPGTDLAHEIHRRTGGNAFFVGETLRHLTESGRIRFEDGRWRYEPAMRELGVPEGVKELIGRRLSRLSEDANRALAAASVAGLGFDERVVASAAELGDAAMTAALEEAAVAGVVVEAGPFQHRFAHQLVRDTLYADLRQSPRIRLHLRVAQAIEEVLGPRLDRHLADLAHHYAIAAPAGYVAAAVAAANRAAAQAEATAAHEEAVRFYDLALEALEWDPDPSAGCDLLLSKATAQWRAGDPRKARAMCEEAAARARSIGDPERLARIALVAGGGASHFLWLEWGQVDSGLLVLLEEALAALPEEDSALRAGLLGMLARELAFVPGMTERRGALVAEAIAMARRIGDTRALALTLCFAVVATSGEIGPEQRVALAEEIAAIGRELDDLELEIQGLFHLAHGRLELGEVVAVEAAMARSEEIAAILGQPFWRWLVTCYAATRLLLRARSDEAERLIAEALRYGEEAGEVHAYMAFGIQSAAVTFARGRTARLTTPRVSRSLAARYPGTSIGAVAVPTTSVMGGRYEEGRAAIEAAARDAFLSINRDSAFAYSFGLMAWATELLWESRYADAIYDALLPYAGRAAVPAGPYGLLTTVDALLAGQACMAGNFDMADAHLDAHDSLAQRIGAPQLLVEAQVRRALVALARGDVGAEVLIQRAEAAATSGPDLGAVAELLDAGRRGISGLPPRPIEQPGSVARSFGQRIRASLEERAKSVVGRFVREKTDAELEKRFGSARVQRMLFSGMARGFRPDLANGFEGQIGFELACYGGASGLPEIDAWTVEVLGDDAVARPGFADSPAMTVRASLADFCRLISEELDPVAAVYDRRVRIEGDFVLALRLGELFGGASALSDVED
jgi:class 3 adenylate cyclase